jgi:hypothetical protein
MASFSFYDPVVSRLRTDFENGHGEETGYKQL